jgi:hypothetical protein
MRRSNRTRIGKIARLPKEVREELNRRLRTAARGEELLQWLNALPKTQKVLEIQHELEPGTLSGPERVEPVKPGQGESGSQ